jgi:transposase
MPSNPGPTHHAGKQATDDRNDLVWKRHLQGLTASVIAQRVGISVNLVKNIIRQKKGETA